MLAKELEIMAQHHCIAAGVRRYYDELVELCEPIVQYFGASYFVYLSINAQGQLRALSTRPTIFERYLSGRHYLNDPHIVLPANMETGVSVWSHCNSHFFQGSWIYELRNLFNIANGVSIVRRKSDKTTTDEEYQVFIFGASVHNTAALNLFINEVSYLKMFTQYFEEKASHVVEKLGLYKIDIAHLKGKLFNNQEGITSYIWDKEAVS